APGAWGSVRTDECRPHLLIDFGRGVRRACGISFPLANAGARYVIGRGGLDEQVTGSGSARQLAGERSLPWISKGPIENDGDAAAQPARRGLAERGVRGSCGR